ncbi:pentapeptide repeat-containing protein [Mycolicibacterium porcinum]|uniref:pentapeptide repeat-containing protein n=1 Tax=Mycolicibacterium porcinum TaxID=39693 RepID=UPI00257A6477|nr:pentapeptide repeat-containing protein [Mycolicibacterium porcinum]
MTLYFVFVCAAPVLAYWAFTRQQNWGEFGRVVAGPIGTVLAAGGAVLAAYLALLNGDRTRAQDRETVDRDRRLQTERDLRARFMSAAEQMGDERFTVRQAGAYTMAAIADDWLALAAGDSLQQREAQVCIDVLCASLRDPAGDNTTGQREEPRDQPVRQVIIRIIASHLRGDTETSWKHLEFDLSGAHLHDVDLSQCHFDGRLSLREASFSGEQATFTGSHFADTTFNAAVFHPGTTAEFAGSTWSTAAQFERTKFGGSVTFDGATFLAGVCLLGAWLGTPSEGASEVSLRSTTFFGTADFSYAKVFCPFVVFDKATFKGSALFSSLKANHPQHHSSVSFLEATFEGPADFRDIGIGGQANFRQTKFLGDQSTSASQDDVDFDSDDAVRFDHAQLWIAEFVSALFTREVSFYRTTFQTRAQFRAAVFDTPARFEAATIENGANFRNVDFSCGATFHRAEFGDDPVDFSDPVAWNDVRFDWDSPGTRFVTSRLTQPPNVLPSQWPPAPSDDGADAAHRN